MRGRYEGVGMDKRMLHALKVGSLASNVSPVVKGLHVLGVYWGGGRKATRNSANSFPTSPFKKSVFCCVKTDLKEFLNVNQYNQH